MLQGRGICDIIKNMSIFYYIIKVALHMRSPAVNSVHIGKLYHILADMI